MGDVVFRRGRIALVWFGTLFLFDAHAFWSGNVEYPLGTVHLGECWLEAVG